MKIKTKWITAEKKHSKQNSFEKFLKPMQRKFFEKNYWRGQNPWLKLEKIIVKKTILIFLFENIVWDIQSIGKNKIFHCVKNEVAHYGFLQ